MLNTILVPVGKIQREKEYEDFNAIVEDLCGTPVSDFTTLQLEGIPGVGIIALDQDDTELPENRLGIKGPFVVIGMSRLGDLKNTHVFESLTSEQVSELRTSITMTSYRSLMKQLEEGDVEGC